MKYTASEREILFKKVINRLQKGKPLGQVLDIEGMPSRTAFYSWCDEDPLLAERYTRAKEIAASALFDRMIQIAETPLMSQSVEMGSIGKTKTSKVVTSDNIARSRLLVDAIKWRLAKEQPTKYGDKIDVTSAGEALAVPAIIGMTIKNEITSNETIEPEVDEDDLN